MYALEASKVFQSPRSGKFVSDEQTLKKLREEAEKDVSIP